MGLAQRGASLAFGNWPARIYLAVVALPIVGFAVAAVVDPHAEPFGAMPAVFLTAPLGLVGPTLANVTPGPAPLQLLTIAAVAAVAAVVNATVIGAITAAVTRRRG